MLTNNESKKIPKNIIFAPASMLITTTARLLYHLMAVLFCFSTILSVPSLVRADNSCVDITIAPFQLSPNYTGEPWVVHQASAYLHQQLSPTIVARFALEEGMQIGIDSSSCQQPQFGMNGIAFRDFYTAKIELILPGPTNYDVGGVLENGETAAIPTLGLDSLEIATIRVKTFRRRCSSPIGTPCKPSFRGPADEIIIEEFPATIRPMGGYCNAGYSETEFDLEKTGSFRQVSIANIHIKDVPNVEHINYKFKALGWTIDNNGKPSNFGTIGHTQPFALITSDFRDEHDAAGFSEDEVTALVGTRWRSGLVWPRIEGRIIRGGANSDPISWYACKLPRVARDVLEFCDNGPNTFYTSPLLNPAKVTQAPLTVGGSHATGYAWDLDIVEGTLVVATRAGVVRKSVGNLDCNASEDNNCKGNVIVIEHDDGSLGKYLHLEYNGSFVDVGERILRGQAIGLSGNTGKSSGPHLHFGHDKLDDEYIDSWNGLKPAPAKFWVWRGHPDTFQSVTCYEPVVNDVINWRDIDDF